MKQNSLLSSSDQKLSKKMMTTPALKVVGKNLDQSTALVVETTEGTQEIVADFCAVRPVDNVSRQPCLAEETYAKMSLTEKSAEATVQVL